MEKQIQGTGNVLNKARAIFELLRPELPIAAGVCVVAGQIVALARLPSPTLALLGFLTGFLISGSAMVTNDYFDLEVDRVNHPNRPLPSGRVTMLELWTLTALLTITGLTSAALISSLNLVLAAATWLIAIAYNWKLKETGLPGNIMVATSVGMTFVFGGATAGRIGKGIVLIFGALAFLFDLGEEIAGGAMDVRGDEKRRVKSLALIYGRETALKITAIIFFCFGILSFAPYVLGWLGFPYLILVTLTDFLLAYFTLKLIRSKSPEEGRIVTRQLYLLMLAFILVFIVSTLVL